MRATRHPRTPRDPSTLEFAGSARHRRIVPAIPQVSGDFDGGGPGQPAQ